MVAVVELVWTMPEMFAISHTVKHISYYARYKKPNLSATCLENTIRQPN
jgi:hypothetical protein